jgi:cell division protein FtsW
MNNWQINSNHFFDRRSLNFIKKWWIDIDKINFLIIFGIIIFGLVITISSSPAIAKRIDVEKLFFVKKQLFFAMIGLIFLISISFLNESKIKVFCITGLIISIVLLLMVLVFGSEAKGAKRWLSFFGFTVQPSEFAKTFFVVTNAYILHRLSSAEWFVKYSVSTILFLIIISLLILQPDFGMTLIFSTLWFVQLFAYGLPAFLISIISVVGIFGAIIAYITFPHVEDRINRFLDADGKNYQVERSLDAFVNGSFFGTGTGNGVVKKFIPDAHTDFVFAVIGEEYGIFACCLLIGIFICLITRIVVRAIEEDDLFTYLSLIGLIMQFSMQVIINIGVSLKLLPTKGMTLPFISYGGSSMIAMTICFGLILALTKRKYHRSVDYGNLKFI